MIKELLQFPKMFWSNRALVWKLAKNDFKTRYAGSNFGVLWALVQPVIIVLVYWFVFEDGFCACVKGYSKIELRHEIKKHGKVVNKYIA